MTVLVSSERVFEDTALTGLSVEEVEEVLGDDLVTLLCLLGSVTSKKERMEERQPIELACNGRSAFHT